MKRDGTRRSGCPSDCNSSAGLDDTAGRRSNGIRRLSRDQCNKERHEKCEELHDDCGLETRLRGDYCDDVRSMCATNDSYLNS